MREQTRWRLILAAAFLAPMAMVKAMELYLNRSLPVEAAAASPTHQQPGVDPAIAELLTSSEAGSMTLSEDEQRLLDYLRHVRQRPIVRSPLELTMLDVEETEPVMNEQEPVAPPSLNVTVQAVMRASGGNVALINGTSYRVGDTLPDERESGHWTIRAIDPAARSVTFEHSSGNAEETRAVLR